jgi:hypothetical protein
MGKIGKVKKISGSKSGKERERYYLLPGQGGHAYRRKQKFILKWSVIAGLIVSAVLSVIMYLLNRQQPP